MAEVVHCRRCGKSFSVKDFKDMMSKLRRHYKEEHPILFRKSVKKGVATRKVGKHK